MSNRVFVCLSLWMLASIHAAQPSPRAEISFDQGHSWRPPFGIQRVGAPFEAVVRLEGLAEPADLELVFSKGSEGLSTNAWKRTANEFARRFPMPESADRVSVFQVRAGAAAINLGKASFHPPEFESACEARRETVINPVDLGTIFVPEDWLLLKRGERAEVRVGLLSRNPGLDRIRVEAWFAHHPLRKAVREVRLKTGSREVLPLFTPAFLPIEKEDRLEIRVRSEIGALLESRSIPVMAGRAARWPRFGASAARLRFDAPISVRDPKTGRLSSMPYESAWEPGLDDVVVSLPNGARFVFWRGSSYVPFWAGSRNTALCYEWAETGPLPDGFVDSVEPLMDKELRYGRVRIVESTPARVQVRWSYQSTDFNYKVWGDSAQEDFIFYPDGFGTRVLTLQSATNSNYELSEFIVLAAQKAYPLGFMPEHAGDLLFFDGEKRPIHLPGAKLGEWKHEPVVFRLRFHRDDPATAVYFNPRDTNLPPVVFGPFSDQGVAVTPAYWGGHWPLARGNSTGASISDRIAVSPSHNSLISWARVRPRPISESVVETVDTLGRNRTMQVQRWAWMIGQTAEPDAALLERARSFFTVPPMNIRGARLAIPSFSPETRDVHLTAEAETVEMEIKPELPWINPVFEFDRPQGERLKVWRGGNPVAKKDFAWDGRVLWIQGRFAAPETLRLSFH